MAKRKLVHVLNERGRKEQRQREEREREKLEEWSNDPRRYDSMEWIKPLINEDE